MEGCSARTLGCASLPQAGRRIVSDRCAGRSLPGRDRSSAGDSGAAAHLDVVRESPGRYFLAHATLLVGLALYLPVILAFMHLLRERSASFGHLGGGLAMIGLFGATAIVAVDGIAVSQMGQPEADAEEMAALLDRIQESNGLRAIAVGSALALLVGVLLLLAYALWRESAVHPLTAGGMAIAAVVFFIGQVTDNRLIFALAFAVYFVSLAPLGRRILAETDPEWVARSATPERAP